jgi:hypothetical protein
MTRHMQPLLIALSNGFGVSFAEVERAFVFKVNSKTLLGNEAAALQELKDDLTTCRDKKVKWVPVLEEARR